MTRTGTLLLGVLLLAACDAPSAPSPPPGPTPPATPANTAVQPTGAATGAAPAPAAAPAGKVDVGPAAVDAVHEYTGGAKAGDKVPLVVAIHGLGDHPQSFKGLFEGFSAKAHFIVPAGGVSWGDGFAWWPIRGAIDERSMAAGIESASDRLAAALRTWQSGHAGKPIVTGFSQGGMLSFALGARYPALVGEAIPVAGLLPRSLLPEAWPAGTAKPRFVALHGDADTRVPYALGQRSVDSLKALGLDAELRSYPGVAHSISAEVRRDLWALLTAAVERAAKGE